MDRTQWRGDNAFGVKILYSYLFLFVFAFVSPNYEISKEGFSEIIDGVSVSAYPLTHTITSFGYEFVEPKKRGKFNPSKAKVRRKRGRVLLSSFAILRIYWVWKELGVPPRSFSVLTGEGILLIYSFSNISKGDSKKGIAPQSVALPNGTGTLKDMLFVLTLNCMIQYFFSCESWWCHGWTNWGQEIPYLRRHQ